MKSVMLSIQPKYCELIASGKKTIEVRKTRPSIETPFKCYIYETKGLCDTPTFVDEDGHISYRGRGQVIGEFVCDRIEKFDYRLYAYSMSIDDLLCTRLEVEELNDYGKCKPLYGWHISDLKIYDKPKELGEFKRDCGQYGSDNPFCDDCKYYICCKGLDFDESDCAVNGYIPITRPPQSWGYVEEL